MRSQEIVKSIEKFTVKPLVPLMNIPVGITDYRCFTFLILTGFMNMPMYPNNPADILKLCPQDLKHRQTIQECPIDK